MRARRIQGKGEDSVVKLRPVVPDELPAQAVEPVDGTITWLTDTAAAAALDRDPTRT